MWASQGRVWPQLRLANACGHRGLRRIVAPRLVSQSYPAAGSWALRSFCVAAAQPIDFAGSPPLESLGDLKAVLRDWEPCIGIEVHAQITSRSKLFSGAGSKPYAPPNSQASVVDLALPGVLPVVNRECVAQGIRLGLAIGGEVNRESRFIRKHYSYCDLPQGYQLTQQEEPICVGGELVIPNEAKKDAPLRVSVDRIQIEQDSGKNIHDVHPLYTYVDYNRAGVGLLEIVSRPDMHSSQDAGLYVGKLQGLLAHIGVCSGHMHDGSMRCDVNVSIRPRVRAGAPVPEMGERVEIKNLNSIKSVRNAIDYEIRRQARLAEFGQPVQRATRTYSAATGLTGHLRSKEQLLDYRFMPCGDLPLLRVDDAFIQEIQASMPELPEQTMERLKAAYNLAPAQIRLLMGEPGALRYLEALVAVPNAAAAAGEPLQRDPHKAVNWLCNELLGLVRKHQEHLLSEVADAGSQPRKIRVRAGVHDGLAIGPVISPELLAEIIDLTEAQTISGKVGKQVLALLMDEVYLGDSELRSAAQIVEAEGWTQISDAAALGAICDAAIAESEDLLAQYRVRYAPRLFSALVNAALNKSNGLANPTLLRELLAQKVGEPVPDGKKAQDPNNPVPSGGRRRRSQA